MEMKVVEKVREIVDFFCVFEEKKKKEKMERKQKKKRRKKKKREKKTHGDEAVPPSPLGERTKK